MPRHSKGPARHAAPARIKLEVVNGDLSFSRAPVVVGRFLGDSISGAESELDFALGGALKRRYAIGLYPGSLGSAVAAASDEGSGAVGVVVGLGDIGGLSPGAIRTATLAGLLELAVCPGWNGGAVALVLLGSKAGTVSFSDTLEMMLAALSEAQRRLAASKLPLFDEARFLSVFEDDAHRIWHMLRRFVAAPRYGAQFALGDEIVCAPGAQRRLMRMDDPDTWRAIQVTAVEGDAGGGGFRFTSAGDRARAEGFLVGAQRGFLDRFLDAARQRKLDTGAARALFQLVWPADLKQSSFEDQNIRLILDEAAAALPFELMDDRDAADESGIAPPAVRRGVLRQLIQSRFARLQATPPQGERALVIGDPRGGAAAADFEPLPGARKEAHAVADLLESEGFEVVRLIGDEVTPDQVVEKVLEGGWTVLHVSAHGIYDYAFRSDRLAAEAKGWDPKTHFTGPRYTGIVLADRLTLDPAILHAMPEPPVFAFINCCDLGTVDAADEERLRAAARPEFAASFAGELIAAGTRAVIAAGWEVSDAGALTFAKSTYRELLANREGFGEAVKIARGDIFAKEPGDATWGAYQCYGEPDWRLRPAAEGGAKAPRELIFASPAEALATIEGLRNRAIVGAEREAVREALLVRLEAVESAIAARGWSGRDGIAEQLGHAAMALGEEDRAIRWFEEALQRDAAPSLRLIEALARLRLRQAFRSRADGGAAALAGIDAVREQLTLLCTVAGATAGRLSLIGKAADRAAQLAAGGVRDTELARMRDAYRQAWKLSRDLEADESARAGLMAVTASILIALRSGGDAAAAREELEDLARELAGRGGPGDYWHAVGDMAHRLLGALIDEGVSPAAANEIVARFRRDCEAVGARLRGDPLLEPMRLIAAVLEDSDSTRPIAEWVASIEAALAAPAPAAQATP